MQRNAQEAHSLAKELWVSKGLADATPG
jgi:hypothetical protein